MKKIKILLIAFILLLFPLKVYASNAKITVSSVSSAVVGNQIKVYVNITSDGNMGAWQLKLNYDTSILRLVGSTAEGGGVYMANSSAGTRSIAYTFTFKALKNGNANLSIGSYLILDYDTMAQMDVSAYGKTIRIMTQSELEASYSKDNYLKNLVVDGYEITPLFNKDVLEYSVTVPENTKTVKITAYVNDGRSSVEGEGEIEVKPGNNKLDIIVRAQNGSQRIYHLNVNVVDSNPIEVKIDNEIYHVNKYKEYLPHPDGYEEKTVKISDIEIPAYYNKTVDYLLVGLKDHDGKVHLFRYKDNKYEKYIELKLGNIRLIPLPFTDSLSGYKKETLDFGEKYEAYQIDGRFKLINAKNILTAEEGIYLYDNKDKTAVKYDMKNIYALKKVNTIYLITTIIFLTTTVLSLIVIVSLKLKRNPKNKDKKEAKEEIKEEKENIIVEVKKPKEKKKKEERE